MDATTFIPLAAKLGSYIKQGADHYAAMKAMGLTVSAETVGAFLEVQMADWNPEIRGRRVLDGTAKHHGAHFLAHVICKLADPAGKGS